ncbi:MAG TPA: tetratricopeptide repeat protein, partial [Candidatus Binatia bacterium]|nr:tetratricopeptide repeat protein [Candidatus Binatia bacterium]
NVLSQVYLSQKHHDRAIPEAERALALDPNYADGYADLGLFLTYAGRPEETIELVEKAMRLNPRYPAYYSWTLGQAHLLTGRYAEGISALKVSLIRNPDFLHVHIDLVLAYSETGQDREAQTAVAEVLRISPSFSLGAAEQILPFRDPAVLERFLAALRKARLT